MSPRLVYACLLCVYVLALCVLVALLVGNADKAPAGTFVPSVQLDPAQVRWAAA